MSFFKDFKEDLSQAVNELMPEDSNGKSQEDIQMVDTLTVDTLTEDEDENEPSIEEMLNNIENINLAGESLEPVIEPMEPAESFEQAAEYAEPVAELTEEVQIKEEQLEDKQIEDEQIEEVKTEEMFSEEPVMEAVVPELIMEPTVEEVKEEPMIEQEVAQMMEKENTMLEDEDRATDETGLITAGMTIKGDIITTGSLEVLGSVEGDIDVKGKLEVAGSIKGNSKAADVYAESAKIIGEIVSTGPVKIGQNSVVKGNITAAAGVFAGAVKGDIDIQGPVILDTTAIIMGNIKSKSIQINNGAVIEGMCSQCYAEVSPTNFFGEDEKPVAKAKK